MKNVHILPTDKPSRLYSCFGKLGIRDYFTTREDLQVTNQHVYITSEDEIKEGDWFTRDGSIHKCFRVHEAEIEFLTSIDSVYCGANTFWKKEFCKKIILTTDPDLIADGVQEIPDEFLEYLVKNPSCEWVEVECSFMSNQLNKPASKIYKIIIPEEEPKQRLEKYSERFNNKENEIVEGVFNPENWGKRLVKEEPKQECCQDVSGFYLGTTCPKCNTPFRSVIQEPNQKTVDQQKQQTAVEWLRDELESKFGFVFSNNILDKANEMFEKQIVGAHLDGQSLVSCKDEFAEQYYNEMYKQ
jgi:hypothetical protein